MAVAKDVLDRGRVAVSIILHMIITPILAFSITYLVNLEANEESITLGINRVEIVWVLVASITSAGMAFVLAVITGGYTPTWVAERGGWLGATRIVRHGRHPQRILNAQEHLKTSGHGRLVTSVRHRSERSSLAEAFGGLQLIAAPFQFTLSIIPILVVTSMPDAWMREGRWMEAVIVVYLVTLTLMIRIFPHVASRFVGAAVLARRWFIRMARVSWVAPLLFLWLLTRLLVPTAIDVLDPNMPEQDLLFTERTLAEIFGIPVVIPAEAFIDLLVALSVLPFTVYTALAVITSGMREFPSWWSDPLNPHPGIHDHEEESESSREPLGLDDDAAPQSMVEAVSGADLENDVSVSEGTEESIEFESSVKSLDEDGRPRLES